MVLKQTFLRPDALPVAQSTVVVIVMHYSENSKIGESISLQHCRWQRDCGVINIFRETFVTCYADTLI